MLGISIILFLILGLVQFMLSEFVVVSSPQLTVLESGFEALKSGVSLSSSFFVLVALFVLFDMELVLFFPGIMFISGFMVDVFSFWSFLLLMVLVTLLLEWTFHGLKWQL